MSFAFILAFNNAFAHGHCPVSGTTLDHEVSSKYTYTGVEYEFCSEKCLGDFKSEPILYMKEALCIPCDDYDAKPGINFVFNDAKYYFCNKGCMRKFELAPEKYLDQINSPRK